MLFTSLNKLNTQKKQAEIELCEIYNQLGIYNFANKDELKFLKHNSLRKVDYFEKKYNDLIVHSYYVISSLSSTAAGICFFTKESTNWAFLIVAFSLIVMILGQLHLKNKNCSDINLTMTILSVFSNFFLIYSLMFLMLA